MSCKHKILAQTLYKLVNLVCSTVIEVLLWDNFMELGVMIEITTYCRSSNECINITKKKRNKQGAKRERISVNCEGNQHFHGWKKNRKQINCLANTFLYLGSSACNLCQIAWRDIWPLFISLGCITVSH